MKRLIAFISILMLATVSIAPAVTLYGGNVTQAHANRTVAGNNTVTVQAWNVSYVKNWTVSVLNASGDDIRFTIKNITVSQVVELKVNGTAVNGYQADSSGVINFNYTQPAGNRTYTIAPAPNLNGYNMTWAWIWNTKMPRYDNATMVEDTVYQNTGNQMLLIISYSINSGVISCLEFGANNPPDDLNKYCSSSASQTAQLIGYLNTSDYYKISSQSATMANIRTHRMQW